MVDGGKFKAAVDAEGELTNQWLHSYGFTPRSTGCYARDEWADDGVSWVSPFQLPADIPVGRESMYRGHSSRGKHGTSGEVRSIISRNS